MYVNLKLYADDVKSTKWLHTQQIERVYNKH